MTDYMKEAERLLAAVEAKAFQLARGGSSFDESRDARAALLAHIQRGAVPEGDDGKRVLREVFTLCEDTEAKCSEETGDFSRGRSFEAKGIARAIGAWYQEEFCGRTHMGEPVAPDQFRDATRLMDEPADGAVRLKPYIRHCQNGGDVCLASKADGIVCPDDSCDIDAGVRIAPAPAGVPMPKPVAYGFGNTAITGHTNRLMMVRIDIPGGDQYAGAFWLPLVLADEAHTYGVACRAAGEAAGYARGLRDAVRDADIEALRLYVRALCKAVDAATDFIGTVAGGASWWDDVWADHAAALDRARERISQAALRGEVKP